MTFPINGKIEDVPNHQPVYRWGDLRLACLTTGGYYLFLERES